MGEKELGQKGRISGAFKAFLLRSRKGNHDLGIFM
jgi:hypothetical protein